MTDLRLGFMPSVVESRERLQIGRDLWSIRMTLAADITDTTSASFIYSRFSENDNRARITKQLCKATSTPRSPWPTPPTAASSRPAR